MDGKSEKGYRAYITPAIHVLFWVSLYVLLNLRWFWGTGPRVSVNMQYRFLFNSMLLVGFFYLNAFYLFPVWYRMKGWIIYLLLIVLAVIVLTQFHNVISDVLFPLKKHWRGRRGTSFYSVLPYIFILGISISYRIISDSARQERRLKEKENETLKTELAFLRSQVSPHFMFNVLNSLVSLARKKSDLMEPSLIQLSGLMRYMLYQSNSEKISLDQEVKYLKSFVDLQLLRFGDDLELEMAFPADLSGYEIEPMLLIALVENAFKHGVGMADNPVIKIKLSLERETGSLSFTVENTIASFNEMKDKSSGIGLYNMQRRLELLYRGRYQMETSQNGNTFVSNLKIKLQ